MEIDENRPSLVRILTIGLRQKQQIVDHRSGHVGTIGVLADTWRLLCGDGRRSA
jgi:hypothetical protein